MRFLCRCLVLGLTLGLILAIVPLARAQAPNAKALTPFEQELTDNQMRFMKAIEAKDSAYVVAAISADFKGVGTNGDFYGRGEIDYSAEEGLPKDWRIYEIAVVRLTDSSAVVSYNQIMPGSHPRYTHISDTWAKENGQWKLKFRQVTLNLWTAMDPV